MWVNEARLLVQHESCEWICGLNESVCNSKQKWNNDECWCDCRTRWKIVLVKIIICGILVRVIVSVRSHVKLTNI